MVQFTALGSLSVLVHGDVASIGGPRQRRLLAMLLIHRNRVVSVDALADAVFAGEPTDAASTTMRSYIARIRRAIGSDDPDVEVITQAPGYVLRAPDAATDVGRFEAQLADGQRHLSRGDPAVAAAAISQALQLWQGGAYAEFADEDWARPEAQRLTELRAFAEERLIAAELACGRASEAIAKLENLIDAHPLREGFRAQLMTALYRTGRQADALRAFRNYRETLANEVGLDPSPTLVDLERRILDHDATLLLAEPAGEPLLGYRLGERLGSGPNGVRHVARLPGVDQEYVVSILRDDRVDAPEFVRTFEATALELASLRHAALIPIHDYWREPGAAYVVSRRLRMGSLRDRIEQAPLTRDELIEMVRRIGGALVLAEQRGVRHGAISLDSIRIDEHGASYITDFTVFDDAPPHDVVDLATTVRECIHRGGLDGPACAAAEEVLNRGAATVGGPSMAEFVEDLLDVLSGTTATVEAFRPNPFKGLRPFDESDDAHFFGRDDLVDELLARVTTHGLTLVVGGSGSGKSSVVRAGLVPRVRRGDLDGSARWYTTSMLPGSAPFKELVECLRRVAVADLDDAADALRDGRRSLDDVIERALPPEGRLLLVIDQFEELFTLTADAEQAAFLDCLVDAVDNRCSRLRIVATLRADFYDRPLAFQRFGAIVDSATLAVPAMSPAALEAAIVEPVEAVGGCAEPKLVAQLIAAVADQPAALPSLQFTLFELADRRPDRCLTLTDYHELGGVDAAIATRAEALYLAMDDAGRHAVRHVFERLVVIGGIDAEPTGRRSPRTSLIAGDAGVIDDVIDRWTEARLLTTDTDPRTRVPTVQLAHEAILRTWPRLQRWIDEDRESIIVLGHLRDSAATWVELDGDDGALYRGARLEQAVQLAGSRADLPQTEHDFLIASVERRDADARESAERAERQERANRRLRAQLGVIVVALVAALVVGFVAVGQRREADSQRRDAEAQRIEANTQRSTAIGRELAAAAEANVLDDPERSILLALAAIEAAGGNALPEAEAALHRAVGASRIVLDVPEVGGRLAVSPLGDVFVTEGPEDTGMIDLRSLETGESVRSWRGDDIDINEVAFSPDGKMLAATGDDGSVGVWDPATGDELFVVDGDGPAWQPRFSADGTRLSVVWTDVGVDKIEIVDTTTGRTVRELPTVGDRPVALSPDGTKLALGSWELPLASVMDVETGEVLTELDVPSDDPIMNVAWSPSGLRIATGSNGGVLTILDATTGERRGVGLGHTSAINAVAWSPDGSMVATGSADGTARVWDTSSDLVTEIHRFGARDLSNGVPGVAFTPDGTRLVVSDWLVTATKVFDLRPEAVSELGGFRVPPGSFTMAFTRDGDGLIAGSDDAALAVRDTATGNVVREIQPGSASPGFAASPDGRFAAIASSAGSDDGFPVTIVDMESDEVVGTVSRRDRWLDHLAWSQDGEHLAVAFGSDDGSTVAVVDRSGRVLATLDQPGFYVPSTAFDSTGTHLAVAVNGRSRFDPERDKLQIWDWQRGRMMQQLDVVAVNVRFDVVSNSWVTTTFNGSNIDLWDASTGEHIEEFAGHTGLIRDITVSSAGNRIATASDDGTARVWDVATGVQLQVLTSPQDLTAVAIDATGTKLATMDSDGVVRVWVLDLDELTAIAKTRVTRTLDDFECRQYLHVDRCDQA